MYGNTEQDSYGTASPNPDYPQEVKNVTGDNIINVCGKNINDGINDYFYITGTGEYFKSSSSDAGLCIKVDALSSYTISTTGTQTRYRVACSNVLPSSTSQNCYNGVVKDGTSDNITVNTNGYKYLLINATNLAIIQIEKGSTATTYEPYQSQSYTVNLGSMELCKIGTYQDYIYKDNESWYLHKEIGKVVLDGSETITRTTTSVSGEYRFGIKISNCKKGLDIPLKSTHFVNTSASTYSNRGIGGRTDVNGFFINDVNLCQMTEVQFKTWLSNNNPEVIYPLATPTTEEITDATLITQLEAIETETGTNIFEVSNENDVLPNLYVLTEKKDSYKN